MATNEILPFASTDTGTNLLTQAEYSADAQRPIGNQPGVARSKLVNKVLKQSSLVAAAFAKYIADNQSTNVTDSLTVDALAALIASVTGPGSIPDASTTVKGISRFATAAEAQAFTAALALTAQGLSQAFQGGNQSLVASGFQKLPGGLILQWGSGTTSSGSVSISFPIAFPNGVICQPIIQARANSAQWYSWASGNVTNSGFSAYCGVSYTNGAFGSGAFNWISLGY